MDISTLVGTRKVIAAEYLPWTAKGFINQPYSLLMWDPEKNLQMVELTEKLEKKD